jgi:hypothetical protein
MYSEAKLAFIVYLWYPKTQVLFSAFSIFFVPSTPSLGNEMGH